MDQCRREQALREAEFEAGPPRVTDVVEEADIGLRATGRLKQDVVVIDGVKAADVPAQSCPSEPRKPASTLFATT